MHHLALEVVDALELGHVPLLVVVVAGAGHQEVGAHLLDAAVLPVDRERPAAMHRAPFELLHPVTEADFLLEVVLGDRLVQVAEDRVAAGDVLVLLPGPEGVAEGVHVRVRADARIAEEIPRPPDGLAPLEDGEGLLRVLPAQVAAHADAADASAHDQDVEVFQSSHPFPAVGFVPPPEPGPGCAECLGDSGRLAVFGFFAMSCTDLCLMFLAMFAIL